MDWSHKRKQGEHSHLLLCLVLFISFHCIVLRPKLVSLACFSCVFVAGRHCFGTKVHYRDRKLQKVLEWLMRFLAVLLSYRTLYLDMYWLSYGLYKSVLVFLAFCVASTLFFFVFWHFGRPYQALRVQLGLPLSLSHKETFVSLWGSSAYGKLRMVCTIETTVRLLPFGVVLGLLAYHTRENGTGVCPWGLLLRA